MDAMLAARMAAAMIRGRKSAPATLVTNQRMGARGCRKTALNGKPGYEEPSSDGAAGAGFSRSGGLSLSSRLLRAGGQAADLHSRRFSPTRNLMRMVRRGCRNGHARRVRSPDKWRRDA